MTIQEIFEILGIDEQPDPWAFIDGLIENSTLSDEVKAEMNEYNDADTSPELMEMMISLLFDSQPDRILSGMNYNQSDINRKLRQL